MDFTGPLVELVKGLWGLASKPLGYIYNLKDNVHLLRKETGALKAKSEDVKARVEREEEEGAQRTNQVENWLGEVHEFVGGVDQILQEAGERDRIKCLSRCLPRNCRSSYRLGKRVDQMLNEARAFQTKQGEFNDVTSPLPRPRVLKMPMDKTVGLDSSLAIVWKWLMDKKQGVIGLYGTGGAGKTTLMKRINEKLYCTNHGFDVIIWLVVSKQVKEYRIQNIIRKQLHIKGELWQRWTQGERDHHLWENMTQKKFVLLIDDVWARLELSKIGVPHPENGSKIVFTTRLEHVCLHMKADKTLRVACLKPQEALALFENNIGKSLVDYHQEVRDLAKNVVEECEGLPLALITVGRAMASKDDSSEWRHALTTLRNRPHKMPGMVEDVYHVLKFSYDSLNDTTRKACFLYCCLFPEDYPIITDELIELWIGEGLLGYTSDLYHMRNEGASILGDLKRACLLESGPDYGRKHVKMHDVIRDMATWIARDSGQRENKWLVIEEEDDMSVEMISKWGEAEKVSLWGEWIRKIHRTPPRCSRLKTLFVRETNVRLLPRGFFDSMTDSLTVLNLSNNKAIELFPEEICNLINLQYLNLSATSIHELPEEIKNLTCLRWLLLDDMGYKILIPTGAITSLSLNVFSQWMSRGQVNEEEVVEELGCMQHLTDLSIIVCKSSSVLKIFESPNLQRCIRRAYITNSQKDFTSIVISGSCIFSHLEVLYLTECENLKEMKISQGIGGAPNCSCFPNLVAVVVRGCKFPDLSWLVHIPKLRELVVESCLSMKEIIGDGLAASRLFSHLESLSLNNLPELTSICDQTLSFLDGVFFHVEKCPGLRKLPLDANGARGSFSVKGDREWWANFEWDPIARVTFQWDDKSPVEEMTFGEAIHKVRDGFHFGAKIGFEASG